MKTISITAAILVSLSAGALADERPARDEIKVRAQYVMPQAEQKELNREGLWNIAFPAFNLDVSDLVGAPSKTGNFKFKNPEAITEEGLTEHAFHITFPEPVLGNPEEVTMPKAAVKFHFKNPKAITEEGLTEEAFNIPYPAPVIGNPEDVQADELKLRSEEK